MYNLWRDCEGLATIEILAIAVALVLLVIIGFSALKGGVQSAATNLGQKIDDSVANDGTGW
ncbi:MAG: hypothetical protein GX295_11775 [Syntrophomonadaceae bacterium]|nr:hypothetical protein [Syntrophomonadaceae bacterium]